jgi:magnesium chelatase family protein
MRYGKIHSAALHGIDGVLVTLEVVLLPGLPAFEIVGLGDSAIRESRNRIRAAISACGFKFPSSRVSASLAPAWLRKSGSAFDLPLALAILIASGQLIVHRDFIPNPPCALGELGLDGQVRPVPGAFNRIAACLELGHCQMILPAANLAEASLHDHPGAGWADVSDLATAAKVLQDGPAQFKGSVDRVPVEPELDQAWPDLSMIKGQPVAVRALTIAAAGWHPLLMLGSPGSGKTSLATTLPGILPPLNPDESRLVTRIQSAASLSPTLSSLARRRPFQAPHFSVTKVALTGGGSPPQPGLCSLAHLGVLFLDELTEMESATVDVLRQPLEERQIHLARLRQQLILPADFLLIAAANPCRCGELFEPGGQCRCTPPVIKNHLSKISGPLLDRIDLTVRLIRPDADTLASTVGSRKPDSPSASAQVRRQIEACWQIQHDRCQQHGLPPTLNGRLPSVELARVFKIGQPELNRASRAASMFHLSVRAYHKILRVARTIADLDCSETVEEGHIAEAITYRIDLGSEVS